MLGAQPVEGDDDLCPVAAADGVGNDVGEVACVAEVQGGLGDADVGLDANEGDARGGRQGGGQRGDEHGELGLVVRRRGEERGERGDGRAELGGRLGGCVDGDVDGVGEGEQLGGGGYTGRGVSFFFFFVVVVVVDERGRGGEREGGRGGRTCCRTRRWHCGTFPGDRRPCGSLVRVCGRGTGW